MKNKLFIIVACFSLMALCTTARAEPQLSSDAISVSGMEINKPDSPLDSSDMRSKESRVVDSFSERTKLRAPTLDLCGNGVIEEDPETGSREQCEFKDGVEITVSPTQVALFPLCNKEAGESCNPDTCRCEILPLCGDGRVSHASGEQCESVTTDGEAAGLERTTMLCQRSKTAGMHDLDSTAYACVDCRCALCGNGVVDPGEDCDGTEGCNEECKMAPPATPKIVCTIKTYGFSNDAAKAMIDPYNARTQAAIGQDLLAEEIYGRSVAQITFPDGGEFESGGEVKAADTAIVHVGGAKLVSIHDMSFRPLQEDVVSKPVLLYPFSVDAVPVIEGSGGPILTKESMTMDLSKVGPIEINLNNAYGDVELDVVDETEGAMNKRVRFKVQMQAPVTKAPGEKVGKVVNLEFAGSPAAAGFVGGGEALSIDPEEVASVTEQTAAEWRAAGKDPMGNCDIIPEIFAKLQYAPIMRSEFKVVSGDVSVPVYTASVRTMGAFGGRAKSPCSLTGAEANVPHILLSLGMIAASIAGVGIVRRKKR